MAIYHLNAKVISRGQGQSAIAAAAYRSGDRLRDEQANEQKYYTARAGRIQFTEIMAPADAPEWAHDRNALWNNAERAEKRKDAQLAREIEVSLPMEMTAEQREWLVKDFAREAFVRRGYAVDIAIHAPDKDADERNHHAHLMVTMRTLGPEGFAANKDRSLNSREQLGEWREQWAHLANRHLERHGHEARIDHRSLKEQGIEREATVHLGYAAIEIEARGGQSDRMEEFRAVLARNDIRVEMKALDGELAILENQAEIARRVGLEALNRSAALDDRALRSTHGRAFFEGAEGQASEMRAERREAEFWQRQNDWKAWRDARMPSEGPTVGEKGLEVADSATGAISKLGDFVTDLLAGPSHKAEPEPKKFNAAEYLTNPAARRELGEARAGAQVARENERAALDRMGESMAKGERLSASDLRNLTPATLLSIHSKGDDAVRTMIADNERYAKRDRDGGRERD